MSECRKKLVSAASFFLDLMISPEMCRLPIVQNDSQVTNQKGLTTVTYPAGSLSDMLKQHNKMGLSHNPEPYNAVGTSI